MAPEKNPPVIERRDWLTRPESELVVESAHEAPTPREQDEAAPPEEPRALRTSSWTNKPADWI